MELPASRADLILHFQPKAEKTVSAFIWHSPHFGGIKDDLVSVAYVKTIDAIDRFLVKESNNFAHLSNYVRISILTGISDYIRDNSTIRAPKNKWVPTAQLVGETIDPQTLEGDRVTEERLKKACRDIVDRTVLRMTLDGSDRKAIATFLCTTQREVRRIAGGILERAKANG